MVSLNKMSIIEFTKSRMLGLINHTPQAISCQKLFQMLGKSSFDGLISNLT